jgi:hypothetical protein
VAWGIRPARCGLQHFVCANRADTAVRDAGFTIVETLVATVIIASVIALVLAIVAPAESTALTEPEISDMQQRLRIAVDAIATDLTMAGAGANLSRTDRPLGVIVASVLPRRTGAMLRDGEDVVADDRISIAYVPSSYAQTTVGAPLNSTTGPVIVNADPGCPLTDSACGFRAGMAIGIYDESGAFDSFKVTDVTGSALGVRHQGITLTKVYDVGARATQIVTVTYWLDRSTARLMKYDNDRTDLPIVDSVVDLRFGLFGEPLAPQLTNVDPLRPSPTYGPRPPPPTVDAPGDTWAAGENCVFQLDPVTGAQVPRLGNLVASADGAPVALDAWMLRDGPWCPDDGSPNRFDADLLRVRSVRVMLRVDAARDALRGPAGPLFARAGTARGSAHLVPDREVRFDVTPRNLNVGR